MNILSKSSSDQLTVQSGGYQSGQMGQTVNLLAQPSEVRILLPPPEGGELVNHAEVAHLVERKPSKLQVAGSSPVFRSDESNAFVAQG